MKVIHEHGARPIKAWVNETTKVVTDINHELDAEIERVVKGLDIEDAALQQAKNIARLPFIHPNGVALMPDVHLGIGATVGSVVPTVKAIIPAAVGVDIGCGMNAVRTNLRADQLPDSLTAIRHQIERDIPLGPGGAHRREQEIVENKEAVVDARREFNRILTDDLGFIGTVVGDTTVDNAWAQLGTLGSGNHFIELCLDENHNVWVMLHSGSRGIGNKIGTSFIDRARTLAAKWFINLPDKDLAYFPEGTPEFKEYTTAVTWAQNYAWINRHLMMRRVLSALKRTFPDLQTTEEAINCHHNYVEQESHFGQNVWVTRKGAIRARTGDLGIIPGSMGQRSYIVRGKGNTESYCSCSHGAGRRHGRKEAKRLFTVDDLVAQTQGVECRKDESVLDEIPSAYKDIDQVMANQADLVEVVHTLKAVLCVKGN
jgi:tRNA-splicing ligase RtcB